MCILIYVNIREDEKILLFKKRRRIIIKKKKRRREKEDGLEDNNNTTHCQTARLRIAGLPQPKTLRLLACQSSSIID